MFVMPLAHRQNHNGHARDLSRAFDRLFDDTVERVFQQSASAPEVASRMPALDLRETAQHYNVQVDLPGIAKEDVKVTIDGKRIAIEAAARSETPAAEGERQLVRERSASAFARRFTLPIEVDEAASQAKMENGVLSLTLVKKVKPASQLAIA